MKMRSTLLALGLLVLAGASPALADPASKESTKAWCEKFSADNQVPAEPCACIAEAVSKDAAITSEVLALVTMDDFKAASDGAKSKIADCVEVHTGERPA